MNYSTDDIPTMTRPKSRNELDELLHEARADPTRMSFLKDDFADDTLARDTDLGYRRETIS